LRPRVLLIAPAFYDLEKRIALAIRELGYEVELIENKNLLFDYHATKSKLKILRRLYFLICRPQIKYIKGQFKNKTNIRFDILFAINGHIISKYLIKKLKEKNPDIYSVLYLWDSTSIYSWKKESRLFDKVYTFDHHDSEFFGFKYHPNFYVDIRVPVENEKRNDLFFVGKFSPDRLKVLDSILEQLIETGLITFFKLWPAFKNLIHNRNIYIFLKKLRIKSQWVSNYIINYEIIEGLVQREYIICKKIKFDDVQKEFLASNVILDVPFNSQTGYSHRLIEALARGKKILTSNHQLQKESFYNENQIRVFDVDNPLVDIQWVKEKVKFNTGSFISGLELSNWLKSILQFKNV
jgi:hypothetical protein